MRILCDMDGVIADWGNTWDELLETYGEAGAAIPRHAQQVTFNLNEGRTPAERQIIAEIMGFPGFYSQLRPIPGARTALRQILKAGHDVRLVTAPWVSNPTCASDKLNWVAKNYGSHWAQRVILTTDKTLVHGDYLIDDKPAVTGSHEPVWEHVLFSQPYNVDVVDKRRITNWADWEEVLA